ncbi:MAG: phage tail assembly chaperone [Pseudomonadota bacterium]
MSRVAWPALMDLGLRQLGLAPDVFWDLTPAELMFLAGVEDGRGALTRSGLDALMEQYPDRVEEKGAADDGY